MSRQVLTMRRGGAIVCLLLFVLFIIQPAAAQVATGRMEGVVQDQTGAVIPGATVSLTNMRTQVTIHTTTDANGFYIFTTLAPSIYRLTGEASGFSQLIIENIEINAAVTYPQNVTLKIGAVTDKVTVEAGAVKVQTAEAQIGVSVTLKDIDTLPQLARGPLGLAVFAPGVSIDGGSPSYSRVNGLRQNSTNARLDGIDANDAAVPRFGYTSTAVNIDSVGEMRVITNGFKAEYGRNAGGQIEMITRSGTNDIHGNAFEFLRNTVLNANRFFSNSSGLARQKFIQNIYGGSLGGPVLHDKTFFFANFQGRRTVQEVERNRLVFTPEARSGLFRWKTPGTTATQSFNILSADPRNIGMDAKVKEMLAIMPGANNMDIGDTLNTAGYRVNLPNNSFEDQFTGKIDHQLTQMHRIFLRGSWQRNLYDDTGNNSEMRYPGRPQGTNGGKQWGFSAGSDWVINPTFSNEVRVGYQSNTIDFLRPDRPQGPGIAMNTMTGVDNPILLNFAQGRNSPVTDITDNLTSVKGRSTWKFGFTTRRTLQYGWNDEGIYPNVSLSPSASAGNLVPTTIGPTGAAISSADRTRFENMYNDLLGRVGSVTTTFYGNLDQFQTAGTTRVRNFQFADYGMFAQNDFRLTPRFTFNIGVRWEQFGRPVERDGIQGTVEDPKMITTTGSATDVKIKRNDAWYPNDLNNFAPRFGFAWDVFGNGKTAVRGGYGALLRSHHRLDGVLCGRPHAWFRPDGDDLQRYRFRRGRSSGTDAGPAATALQTGAAAASDPRDTAIPVLT